MLMGQLRANNMEVEHESEQDDAGIIIINTCGFIDNAKQESIDTILRFAEAKENGLVNKLYVTGCLSERYKPELQEQIPEVDSWFGTRDLPRLLKTLKADYKHELVGERLLTTPHHYAYLKISEGCDRPCSFCAIPLMRGKHLSIPEEQLIQQAKKLAANGTRELLLIAQDSTYYGIDTEGKRTLHKLLEKLAQVDGIDWIRLHYAFPTGFPMEVLEVIKAHPNICNYLDMPLQHVSDAMLKSMRRGTTREKTTRLINEIRNKIPDIAIRTTLICGYPGESEDDHQQMAEWIQEMRFDRLGVFTYSHEENTHAYKLQDDVPDELKQERAGRIMEIQQGISAELNQKKVGKTFKVLIDRVEGDYYIGRTEYDSPEVDNEVLVKTADNYLRIGDFANITIHQADDFDLYGSLAK
jgi:ribosomal protein S12 methylthiotransferase